MVVLAWIVTLAGAAVAYVISLAGAMKTVPSTANSVDMVATDNFGAAALEMDADCESRAALRAAGVHVRKGRLRRDMNGRGHRAGGRSAVLSTLESPPSQRERRNTNQQRGGNCYRSRRECRRRRRTRTRPALAGQVASPEGRVAGGVAADPIDTEAGRALSRRRARAALRDAGIGRCGGWGVGRRVCDGSGTGHGRRVSHCTCGRRGRCVGWCVRGGVRRGLGRCVGGGRRWRERGADHGTSERSGVGATHGSRARAA